MPDARYNRITDEPGGMECEECGVIFIGADYHRICAVCAGINEPPPESDKAMITEARQCAEAMRKWRRENRTE